MSQKKTNLVFLAVWMQVSPKVYLFLRLGALHMLLIALAQILVLGLIMECRKLVTTDPRKDFEHKSFQIARPLLQAH